jgi:hypothetical protein
LKISPAPTVPGGRLRRSISSTFVECAASRRQTTHRSGRLSIEKGVSKIDGAGGFADVWKRGCEYKKDRANLDRAYKQLQLYSVALKNFPLLIVSDTYTNWTNGVSRSFWQNI